MRSFPFDKIKIDRSFIGDLSKGDDAVAIVHAILNLAKSLKMTTTAEGVETADQQKLLQAAGCNEMQGYLFSPPRRAAEIAELFGSQRRPDQAARGLKRQFALRSAAAGRNEASNASAAVGFLFLKSWVSAI